MRDSDFEALWRTTRGRFVARIEAWLRELHVAGELVETDFELLAEGLGAVLEQLAFVRIALAEQDPTPEAIAALGRSAGELWSRALPRAARAGD